MVLESELVDRLREFLRTSDLSKTTTTIVRQKLEEDFGVDLAEMFIREQIDNFFISEFENNEKEVKGGEEEGQKAEVDDDEEGCSGGEDAEEDEADEPRNAGGSSAKRSKNIKAKVKKSGGGFTKLCSLSQQLQDCLGGEIISRIPKTEETMEVLPEDFSCSGQKSIPQPIVGNKEAESKESVVADSLLLITAMTGSESGGLGIELMLKMVEQLGKSCDEMLSHRESLSHDKYLLEYIKQHFLDIQKSLQEKYDELENKERAFEEKNAVHRALVEEQETAVDAKEQVSWDHLQELKDAAVSAITEARMKIKVACPVLDNKVHASANEFSNATFPAQEGYSPVNKVCKLAEALTGKVEPRPRLKQLCEQMDAKGLLKLISENRKNFAAISDELPLALRGAPKPANLVLETIEGFYPQNLSNSNLNAKDSNNRMILRRSCLLLMKSAAALLQMSELGGQPGDDHLLSSENKQRAKVIADEWILKLAEVDLDASKGYSLEAQAFLQLLATFSISSEFNKDELCRLVVAVSRRRRQAPEFCRALDLTHKTQDVIAAVITKRRLIDAVHLSHSFQLTEVFPLVPLLKQYLDDAMKKGGRTIASGGEHLEA